jgi:hypothetical protein
VAADLKPNHARTKGLVQHLGVGRVIGQVRDDERLLAVFRLYFFRLYFQRGPAGPVQCRERLGDLLPYYNREGASDEVFDHRGRNGWVWLYGRSERVRPMKASASSFHENQAGVTIQTLAQCHGSPEFATDAKRDSKFSVGRAPAPAAGRRKSAAGQSEALPGAIAIGPSVPPPWTRKALRSRWVDERAPPPRWHLPTRPFAGLLSKRRWHVRACRANDRRRASKIGPEAPWRRPGLRLPSRRTPRSPQLPAAARGDCDSRRLARRTLLK